MTTSPVALLEAFVAAVRGHAPSGPIEHHPTANALIGAAPEVRAEAVVLALEELYPRPGVIGRLLRSLTRPASVDYWAQQGLRRLVARLLRAKLPLSEAQIVRLLEAALRANPHQLSLAGPIRAVQRFVQEQGLLPEVAELLARLQASLARLGKQGYTEQRELAQRLDLLLGGAGEAQRRPLVEPGVWGDEVRDWLARQDEAPRAAWEALFAHAAQTAGKSRPSQRWLRQVEPLVAAVTREAFVERLIAWADAAKLGWTKQPQWGERVDLGMSDANQDLLKGLVWAAATLDDESLAHALGRLGERCYRKIKDFGPASQRLGNACVHALSLMPGGRGVAGLSRLAGTMRYASGRQQVERALQQAAERAGQTREDLEELAVPDFGLDRAGCRGLVLGEHTAELAIGDEAEVVLRWRTPGGKAQKSVPKAVREDHAESLKRLRREIKELKDVLAGQSGRLQRLYLQDRRLPLAALRARYLEHPVVGQLARRLLWLVRDGSREVEVWWRDGRWVTLGDATVALSDEAESRLWHVLDARDLDRLQVWRDHLEERGLRQPFKQLWREVYRPLAPEASGDRRFAGHIVRQHPLRNLCQQRGWQYNLQGYWDSHNYPTLELPRWNLIATLAVDPVEHEKDEQYIFNYLVTGELQFFRSEQQIVWDQPLAPREVPPLVFSEVMRDVDLFVGVSTVANDPEWSESGIRPSWRRYWRAAAWGELAPVAATRRSVLERVLPRTILRDRARLEERWLVVQSETGRYRVHLGSAHARRDDDDAPLAVAPDRKAKSRVAEVFLPFEGDSMLTTILAKAFVLAEGRVG